MKQNPLQINSERWQRKLADQRKALVRFLEVNNPERVIKKSKKQRA